MSFADSFPLNFTYEAWAGQESHQKRIFRLISRFTQDG